MSTSGFTQTPIERIQSEVGRAVAGKHEVIEQIIITLLCSSHSLLEGVAGVAKWLAVQSVAKSFGLVARKLRGSPDLTICDILPGSEHRGTLEPISLNSLGNFQFVDGVDRLSPKLHNFLQEIMQDGTVANEKYQLPDPFVIFAARSPNDQPAEDTILHDDRYLFKIDVGYPAYDEEFVAANAGLGLSPADIQAVISSEELLELRAQMLQVEMAPSVVHYAVRLVRATRVHEGENLDFMYEWVQRGAGPRATVYLVQAAKARAVLHGNSTATHEDLRAIALPTLRHRVLTNQNAAATGVTADRVIQRLLEDVPQRVAGDNVLPSPGQSFNIHNWAEVE